MSVYNKCTHGKHAVNVYYLVHCFLFAISEHKSINNRINTIP